jgi:hypothetical protein
VILGPGSTQTITGQFTPEELGEAHGNLQVTVAETPDILTVPAVGAGALETAKDIFYVDGPWDAVDIVFAIDSSGSMGDDQSHLASEAIHFVAAHQDLDFDWQLAGVDNDDGCAFEILDAKSRGAVTTFRARHRLRRSSRSDRRPHPLHLRQRLVGVARGSRHPGGRRRGHPDPDPGAVL